MISAESEWVDNYAYAQALLDRHGAARDLIDEVRRRADDAPDACGDLHTRPRAELDRLADRTQWRPIVDYRAAVLKAARSLALGEARFDVVRELASRDGYVLARPPRTTGRRAPAPAVASKMGADLNDISSWGSGTVANRQARQRYLETIASQPDRPLKFNFEKGLG